MSILRSAVDNAQAAIEKLVATRRKLDAEALKASEELAALRSVSADAVLDEISAGGKPGAARKRIQEIEGELTDLVTARRACCLRISKAILELGHAKAEAKRDEAKPIQAELAKYNAECERLLGLLRQHTGIEWGPVEPWAMVWSAPGLLPDRGKPKLARGTELQIQIGNLNQEAARIEEAAREKANGGRVLASGSLAELLAAIAPEPLAPVASDVTAWVGKQRGAKDFTFTLVFTSEGKIDESQSEAVPSVPVSQFAEPAPYHAPRGITDAAYR